jgi:hypothetical protein
MRTKLFLRLLDEYRQEKGRTFWEKKQSKLKKVLLEYNKEILL